MIPSHLEPLVIDPVSLEHFEKAQVTNCQGRHHFSLATAILVFGEMQNGATTKQAPCPTCRGNVTNYQPDPQFQEMVNVLIKQANSQGAVLASSSTAKTTPTTPTTLATATATVTITTPTTTSPAECTTEPSFSDEEYARTLQAKYDQEGGQPARQNEPQKPYLNGSNNIVSDVIIGDVQVGKTADEPVSAKYTIGTLYCSAADAPAAHSFTSGNAKYSIGKIVTTDNSPISHSFTSGNDKYSVSIGKGATVQAYAMGPGAVAQSSTSVNYINIAKNAAQSFTSGGDQYSMNIAKGTVVGAVGDGARVYSSSTAVAMGHGSQAQSSSSSSQAQRSASSSNQGFVREFNLQVSENCKLPSNSENCIIRGNTSSSISIGDNSQHIQILGGISNNIKIGQYSHDIQITGNTSNSIKLENNCSNGKIKSGVSGNVKIGNNCQGLTIEINTSGTLHLGDCCSNIVISKGISTSFKLGKDCHNIIVNGGRVA